MGRQLSVRALASVVVGLALMLPASFADARASNDDNPAIGKITLLNRKAMEEYQKLNFDEAQRLLDQALDMAASSGLSQHPVRARTYVTLGVVTLGGLKRRDVALRLFKKALQIQPEIQLPKDLATPEVQAAFDEAVQGLGSEPSVERLPSELLVHDPIKTATRGEAIPIVVVPDESLQADQVVLAYRAAGAPTFNKSSLARQVGGTFEGAIPALATTGKDVTYYIEARNVDGKLVAARGSPVAPLPVALTDPAPGTAAADTVVAAGKAAAPAEPALVLGLLVGSGVGWASGTGEVTSYQLVHSGMAWAEVMHFAPQIGYFVTPRLMIGVEGRLQLVLGNNEFHPATSGLPGTCGSDVCAPARGAFAGLAKAQWFFGDSERKLRPFGSVAVGAGYIRHVVKLDSDVPANNACGSDGHQLCVDTVAAGPLLGGVGVGFQYKLSQAARFVLTLQALAAAPQFTVNADVNLGVVFVL
jgi:hypothetical protein